MSKKYDWAQDRHLPLADVTIDGKEVKYCTTARAGPDGFVECIETDSDGNWVCVDDELSVKKMSGNVEVKFRKPCSRGRSCKRKLTFFDTE